MKRIINGTVFDTSKATKVAENNWEETLYCSPKGRFFVAGTGRPLSSWVVSVGQNSWEVSRGVRIMSREDTLEWIERAGLSPDSLPEIVLKSLSLEMA